MCFTVFSFSFHAVPVVLGYRSYRYFQGAPILCGYRSSCFRVRLYCMAIDLRLQNAPVLFRLWMLPFQNVPVLFGYRSFLFRAHLYCYGSDLTFSERACAVWAIDLTASERACTVWLSILLLQNAPVLFLDDALTLGESGPADLRPARPASRHNSRDLEPLDPPLTSCT